MESEEKMRGKQWTAEEEKQLEELVAARKPVGVIAESLGKSSESVRVKVKRLGLVVVDQVSFQRSTTTTSFELPMVLPSIETTLKKLVAAMNALETPGLSKNEIARLRSIIQAVSVYQVKIAEYMDYRGIEAKLVDLDEKYARLVREKGENSKA
jgi:hypothetical protein